jgi:Rrf2 family protein
MAVLSNTCQYAVRASIYLALNGGEEEKIGIKKISEELDIPSPFLSKILQNLVKYKILSSTKGPHGGFGLEKKADDITMLEIIEIIDGNGLFEDCLIGLRSCKEKGHDVVPCPMHKKYRPISNQLYKLFKNTTIGELAKEIEEAEGKIGI